MRFTFTGNLRINGSEQRNPSITDGKTKNGVEYKRLGFGVASAQNNSAWVELFGMKNDPIKTVDTDNNNIEIDIDDRFDADVISSVANYRKNIININTEDGRKEFILGFDAIEYVASHIDEIKTGKYTVTGSVDKNVYNGAVSDRFTIQNIYAANEDTKAQLKLTDTFYFNKDSFDTADWKEEHKLIIDGWNYTFFDKNALGSDKGANKYCPLQLVFDCSKIDWENEKHVKLVKYKLKQIGCELVDGKIKCNLKKGVYKIPVIISYVNGAQEEEFTEDMLTDNQREAISLGLKDLNSFRPSGNIYGPRVTMYKLSDFELREPYENGCIEADMTTSELEDELFIATKEETLDDVEKKVEEPQVEEDDDDEPDEDDLFS